YGEAQRGLSIHNNRYAAVIAGSGLTDSLEGERWHDHRDGCRQHRTRRNHQDVPDVRSAEPFRRGVEPVQAVLFHGAQRALWPVWPLWPIRALWEVLEIFEVRGSRFDRMTGGAFSLSPPGSFPLSADPAYQDEVRRELECVLVRVRECGAARSVAGVL